MKKILVLVASQTNLPFILAAKELGHYVITCDNNPSNPGHFISDEQIYIDVNDALQIWERIKNKNVDWVVSFVSSHGLKTASVLSDLIGTSGYLLRYLEVLMDKGKFRCYLKAHHYTYPLFQIVSSSEEIRWADIQFPSIVKPVDSGGSVGVSIVHSKKDLLNHLSFAYDHSVSGEVIIEQYIESGKNINGDCLVINGEIIAATVGEYLFDNANSSVLPIATIFPTREDLSSIDNQLGRIVRELKFPDGIFNFEAIIKDNQSYIIEINPRPSGNYIWKLMGYQYQTNILKYLIHLVCGGKNISLKKNDRKYAYQIVYTTDKKEFGGLRLSPVINHIIKETILFKQPGDIIEPFQNLFDRVAIILLEMKNREEVNLFYDNADTFKL